MEPKYALSPDIWIIIGRVDSAREILRQSYNSILELYNVLLQARFAKSKTKLDI